MFKDNVTVLGNYTEEVFLSIAFDVDSDENKAFESRCAMNPKVFRHLKKSYSSAGKTVNYSFYIERKYLRLLDDYCTW